MKIALIFATRPEIIKLWSLLDILKKKFYRAWIWTWEIKLFMRKKFCK